MDEHDVSLHERVAKIEERVKHIDQLATRRNERTRRIEEKLDSMEKDLERYRGMVGAVLLVVTAIGTFVKLFWQDLLKLLHLK